MVIYGNINADPVGRVEYLGKVFRITVLPPPDPGFIRIVNSRYIRTLQAVAGILLLKICTLPQFPVPDRKNAFGFPVILGHKSLFNDLPLVYLV
jgi:hypothetical protein